MKIDLEKELWQDNSFKSGNLLWLKIIAGFCAVNLIILLILFVSLSNNFSKKFDEFLNSNTQLVYQISVELKSIKRLQKQLRATQKKSTKELTVVTAAKKIEEKRKRMEEKKIKKSDVNPNQYKSLNDSLQNQNLNISDEEKSKLDDIIDRDETGAQLKAYIRPIPSKEHKATVIAYLKRKGNQWFNATIPLIEEDDPDVDIYIQNTKYFFNIIRDTSDNSADIAYAGSKLNQLDIAIQKADIRKMAEEQIISRKEDLENLKEDLMPQETPEQAQTRIQVERRKNSIIKSYNSTKVTHPYSSDWDPDPRVREERGIE